MSSHIGAAEWKAYFSRDTAMNSLPFVFARVHAHIGECEECRSLWQKASQVYGEVSGSMAETSNTGDSAYLAVAAPENKTKMNSARNTITMMVAVADGEIHLLPEAPVQTGEARMFAFRIQNNLFTEDCDDSLFIKAEGNQLIVSMAEFECSLEDDMEQPITPASDENGITVFMPEEDGVYSLVMEMK